MFTALKVHQPMTVVQPLSFVFLVKRCKTTDKKSELFWGFEIFWYDLKPFKLQQNNLS